MAGVIHVLCGPAGSGKTGRLLGRFLERARSAPGAALWLGPTGRAVEAVRGRVLGEAAGLCGSRLCTFRGLVDEVVRANDPLARPLSDVQRRLLAEEVVAGLDGQGQVS